MKKILLLVAIGIIISNLTLAQNKYFFGINGGTTYSNLRGNEMLDDNKYEFGYLIGVSFDYYLKEDLSLKANLNFERKSSSREENFMSESGDDMHPLKFRLNVDYLLLPVLIKYDFGINNNFYINGGPFIGYQLSSKAKSDDMPTQDLSGKKLDLGLTLGMGTVFSINETNDISVELRDNLGLINTADRPVMNDGSIKTNSWSFVVNWRFEI